VSCFQSSPAGNASLDHQGNGRGREPSGEPSGTAHFKLFPMSLPSGFTLRRSTTADLDTLVEHRRAMFQDMGYTDQETMGAMAAKFRPWLLAHMNAGDYLAWVITAPHDFIAASSGLWLMDWPPHLVGKGTHRGNILNVYTYPSFRRRGLPREWRRHSHSPRQRLWGVPSTNRWVLPRRSRARLGTAPIPNSCSRWVGPPATCQR